MAGYYALLARAAAALRRNDEASRREIYVKARSALIKQLKAINPPLPAAKISKQRLALEEAIRRVEREAVEAAAAAMLSEEEITRRAEQALEAALAVPPEETGSPAEADETGEGRARRGLYRGGDAPGAASRHPASAAGAQLGTVRQGHRPSRRPTRTGGRSAAIAI